MLSVQNNMLAKNASRQLNVNTKKNAKISEKLSSGYRINRAADDAAGLAVSEKMRRQIRGLNQGSENIKDGVGYVQTAEGALNEVQEILQRINALAVKAANATNNVEDRAYINEEIQALKAEMARIFSATTFNEHRIWVPKEYAPVTGYEKQQAVTFRNVSALDKDVTNANCGVVALGGYSLDANTNGLRVSWTGYDGNTYEIDRIDWNTLEKNNYSFDIKPTDNNGNVLFEHKVSLNVHADAALDDIIKSLDGAVIYSSPGVSMDITPDRVGAVSLSAFMNYSAAYASHINSPDGYDFDQANDLCIEPDLNGNNSNLTKFPSTASAADAKGSSESWEFSFNMEGIGKVTAKPASFYYYSDDFLDQKSDYEGIWWNMITLSDGRRIPTAIPQPITDMTFRGVMSALTGDKNDPTPGLLNSVNGGTSDRGGEIYLNFSLTSDNPYNYGNGNSETSVGTIIIGVNVNSNDTEDTVYDKIVAALNRNTVVDLYNTSARNDSNVPFGANPNRHEVELPVYGRTILGGTQYFWVQAGTESGQHIDIEYESLSLSALGIQDTDVLTIESASRAIDEVKGALQVISDQRSLFGAYQNRLEHAYNINKNVEENTQASESLIRDTDIAEMMMEYSINNILLQAGASMLTQANQSNRRILELLG